MADYTFKELKKMTVAKLRDVAKDIEHEAVQGYTQLNKEHLIEAICKALNIDMFEHHVAKGLNKKEIKTKIKDLKQKRDEAIAGKDYKQLKTIRREIKTLKNQLRRAAV